MRIFVMLV